MSDEGSLDFGGRKDHQKEPLVVPIEATEDLVSTCAKTWSPPATYHDGGFFVITAIPNLRNRLKLFLLGRNILNLMGSRVARCW